MVSFFTADSQKSFTLIILQQLLIFLLLLILLLSYLSYVCLVVCHFQPGSKTGCDLFNVFEMHVLLLYFLNFRISK